MVTRPYHGLGNRIRVVLSGQLLAERHGRSFAYVWPTGRHFGARLDQLWQVDERRISPARSWLLARRHPYRDASLDWLPTATSDNLWQIRTSQPIAFPEGIDEWHPLLRGLVPVPEIQERIMAVFDEHLRGRPYVGVMVRTHSVSHENTLKDSPLEWYLERLAQIRREHGDIPFYVSADTVAGEAAVREAFPGSVGLGDKGAYNSLQALQASLVDLYLLASSAHIIGPHYSSFPELASYLAEPAIRLETSQSPEGSRLEVGDQLTVVSDPLRPWRR
ncbi:MAG: hypothetical protein QM708_11410 [Propioniciclava sp.]|uniref:hypothetical protein n=1 Tax=Propioniciclava sp. TaxID=2038686 RepID=UPI0039E3582B